MIRQITLAMSTIFIPFAAHAKETGRWCDVMVPSMTSLDAIVVLKANPDGKHVLEVSFQDGSTNIVAVTKKGSAYYTNNNFGEFYRIRSDGQLGIHDSDGFIRAAKPARASAKPGACR